MLPSGTRSTVAASAAAPATRAAVQVLVPDLGNPVAGHLEEALVEALELRGAVRRDCDGHINRLPPGGGLWSCLLSL